MFNKQEKLKWLENHQEIVNTYIERNGKEKAEQVWNPTFGTKLEDEIKDDIERMRRVVYNRRVDDSTYANCKININNIEEYKDLLNDLRTQINESLYCFYMDEQNNVLGYDEFTENSTSTVQISNEQLEYMCQRAKEHNANIYCIHNHPVSFTAIPSDGDHKFRERKTTFFNNRGIKLIDDCIITIDDYWSYTQTKNICKK